MAAVGRHTTGKRNHLAEMTDDSLRVRQLSHYQFSWVAGDLQDVLRNTKNVFYDVGRGVLMFGVTKAGA
jgi:hypothetical protein